jgi:hypothetical protein
MLRFITISFAAALSLGVTLPASAGSFSSADTVMLNPQPLPPRDYFSSQTTTNFDAVMLNPQPLPPKEKAAFMSHGDEVMLNPQPLPPKIFKKRSSIRIKH